MCIEYIAVMQRIMRCEADWHGFQKKHISGTVIVSKSYTGVVLSTSCEDPSVYKDSRCFGF